MAAVDCDFPDPATGLSCCWPLDISKCCPPGDDTDDNLVESAVAQASVIMTRLSGYTIGQCGVTVRPLSQCRKCRVRCCGGADGIRMTGPNALWIESVTEVRDGATIVDPDEYRWDNEEQVLWRTPPNKWPTRDKRWAKDGEDGAFVVDIVVGSKPDAYDLSVAQTLACELIKNCLDEENCRLPKNVTTVSAQGVTITMSDLELKSMISEVAGWVQAVNPYNATLPARVFSPELESSSLGGCCRGY